MNKNSVSFEMKVKIDQQQMSLKVNLNSATENLIGPLEPLIIKPPVDDFFYIPGLAPPPIYIYIYIISKFERSDGII